jgi:type I restriction enzyme R subunit
VAYKDPKQERRVKKPLELPCGPAGGIRRVQKLRIDNWRAREATRDDVRVTIRDFLWSDETGLPEKYYSEEEVTEKAEDVYRHIYRTYPTVPSPFYACA